MPDIRPKYPFQMVPPPGHPNEGAEVTIKDDADLTNYENQGYIIKRSGGSRRRRARRPSRKYKKSAKRVFRKKSRSTRRR